DRTLRHGSSAESWNAMPSSWLRRSSSGDFPSTSADPLVGFSSPARIRRIVDLPHPDGPSSDKKLPWSVNKVASSRAVTRWRPIVKVLVRFCRRTPVPREPRTPPAPGAASTSGVLIGASALELGLLLVQLGQQR